MPARALPTLNAAWHRAHRMPKNPTAAQRLAWHTGHARHCACRPTPKRLLATLAAAAKAARRKTAR